MSAIASAGGPSDFAGDKINLIRNGAVTLYRYKLLKKNPIDDRSFSPAIRWIFSRRITLDEAVLRERSGHDFP